MAQGRPYQAYQTNGVATSNQKQLVVMLFDGMHRFLSQATKSLEAQDFEGTHISLHKTGKILLELINTLNEEKGGEIARNLKSIYLFCYEQVVISNLKKDAELIKDVQEVLNNIRLGFKEATQKQQITGTTPQTLRVTG